MTYDRNTLQHRHDIFNTARRVHEAMSLCPSWEGAKGQAISLIQGRIARIKALSESEYQRCKDGHFENPMMGEQRNEDAFTVDGYMVPRTLYSDAVAEVVASLERDIGFVRQLTKEQFVEAKEKGFRNV